MSRDAQNSLSDTRQDIGLRPFIFRFSVPIQTANAGFGAITATAAQFAASAQFQKFSQRM
jgi:hypothetical protein